MSCFSVTFNLINDAFISATLISVMDLCTSYDYSFFMNMPVSDSHIVRSISAARHVHITNLTFAVDHLGSQHPMTMRIMEDLMRIDFRIRQSGLDHLIDSG